MCGTLTLNLSKCPGFKIRTSIIHKFINILRLLPTDKTHLSNFLILKGLVPTTTRTSKAISFLPTLPTNMPKKITMKIFQLRINKFLLQTEENQ